MERPEENHSSDCAIWVDESCDCIIAKEPKDIYPIDLTIGDGLELKEKFG